MSATSDGLPVPERFLAFTALAMATTMAALDGAIANVALPTIARDLGVSAQASILVVNGYQLAVTACLLPFALLGEIIGYKRVHAAGLALLTAASLACALADSLPVLVVARIAQGVGAAGVMSVGIALVRFIYPHRSLGRGLGNIAVVVAVSSAAGPAIAAVVLAVASWPWLFLINVPVGVVALIVALRTLPATPRSDARLDVLSALLNASTFGLLIVGIDRLGDTEQRLYALGALAASAVIGTVFVRRQVRLPVPVLPVDLLRIPLFALSIATSVCSFAAQGTAFVALPFYFQDVLGRSDTETGFLMTPWPLAIACVAPISGRLADRYPPGLLGGLGLAALSLGLALTALLPAAPTALDVTWRLTICGLGFGLFQAPNNRALITSAPRERSGGASGMQSSARLVGQSLGAALVAVLFGLTEHALTATLALWCAAGLAAAGCLASSLRRSPPAVQA